MTIDHFCSIPYKGAELEGKGLELCRTVGAGILNSGERLVCVQNDGGT